jgi:hypothetical protein
VIKQKTGLTEKSIDTAFAQEESNLKRNKTSVEAVYKDSLDFLEAIRSIIVCRALIAFHTEDETTVDKCRRLEDYFCSDYVKKIIMLGNGLSTSYQPAIEPNLGANRIA